MQNYYLVNWSSETYYLVGSYQNDNDALKSISQKFYLDLYANEFNVRGFDGYKLLSREDFFNTLLKDKYPQGKYLGCDINEYETDIQEITETIDNVEELSAINALIESGEFGTSTESNIYLYDYPTECLEYLPKTTDGKYLINGVPYVLVDFDNYVYNELRELFWELGNDFEDNDRWEINRESLYEQITDVIYFKESFLQHS